MRAAAANPAWVEVVQLVPIVTLASSFLVSGEVDLARAAPLFLLAAGLGVAITALVLWRRYLLNPILVGANLWLVLGAAVFATGWVQGSGWVAEARAAGLFACAAAVGVATHAFSPFRYLGARSSDPAWLTRASLGLFALTVAAVAWSWGFRADLRIGGGLPFIAVNVARRVLIARAP